MSHAQVIELLGAPASGKSSIATALAARPGVVLLKDHEPADLPSLAWSAVRASPILRFPPPEGVGRARWAAWAGRLRAAPALVDRRDGRGATVVLFDQGPAYTLGRLTSLRRHDAGDAWWRRRAAECGRLLDLVVLLEVDERTLARRLRERSKAHVTQTMDDAEIETYLVQQQLVCRRVADAVAQAGATVLRLDTGEGPAREHVAAIMSTLPGPMADDERGSRR